MFLLYHIYDKLKSAMIDLDSFFNGVGTNVDVWCGGDTNGVDLARMVEVATQHNAHVVSVLPDVVPTVWPWLENSGVKIYGRFYLDEKIDVSSLSDLTIKINQSFKYGANGAMVFVRYKNLSAMVDQVAFVRDDLFFNRDLVVGLDIGDVDSDDWVDLFRELKRINASAVCFVLTKDAGKKSDFVGRVYGLLNAWDSEFGGALHFALENRPERIDQARRLVESIRPELMSGLRFFVNY